MMRVHFSWLESGGQIKYTTQPMTTPALEWEVRSKVCTPPPLCTTAFPPSDQALSFASGLAFAHLRPSLPFSRSFPSPLLFRLPFSSFLCGRFLFSVQFRPDLTGVGHLQQSPLPALSLDCVLALSGLSFSSLSPFSSVPLFSCPLRSSPLLLSSRCSWCGSRGFSFLCHWAGRFMAPQAPRHNGSGSTKPSGHLHPCVAPSWLLPLPQSPHQSGAVLAVVLAQTPQPNPLPCLISCCSHHNFGGRRR